MKRLLLPAFVVLAAALPADAAKCVNPGGTNGCYNTIQGAVDVAVAGETIIVQPGTYLENVTIPSGLDGLTLRGIDLDRRPRTILDPDAPNFGTGITIQSSRVTVLYLKIRNGVTNGIYVDADYAVIADNQIISPESDGISLSSNADYTRILRNDIRGVGSEAIYSFDTDGLFVGANVIGPCDSGCIDIDGDDIQVISNTVVQSEDSDCVEVDGDRPIIRNNILKYCDNEGVDTYGANPTIVANTIRGSAGMNVDCYSCTGGVIRNNSVEGVGDDEGGLDIYADATGLVVSGNTVANVTDEGFNISGTGIVFQQNIAKSNGGDNYEPGIEIYGDGHQVMSNQSIGNVEHGFYVSANNCTINGNVAVGNMGDGFEINGTSNTLNGNRSINNAGEGFQAGGTTQTFTNNVSSQNRVAYCETSSGHTLTNNAFPTTGPCEIDN